MPRALVLAAALLAACGPSASGLDPAAAVEAADEALLDRDADRALALLTEAADAGDLGARRRVVEAYERGYMRTPYERGRTSTNLAVTTWPGRAAFARRAYERALADHAEAGDPDALLAVAFALTGPLIQRDGTWESEMDAADRDSVVALHARLDASDVPRLALSSLARALGDEDAALRHLDEAVAAGEPNACYYRFWFGGDRPAIHNAEGTAAYYDAMAACSDPGFLTEAVGPLFDNAAAGMPEAVVFVDSLRAEGVFERHPRLEALLAEASADA